MNKHDLQNLNFIMSLSDEGFDEWIMGINDDDINYAIELIQYRREQLAVEASDLIDLSDDFTEANAVINRIKAMK